MSFRPMARLDSALSACCALALPFGRRFSFSRESLVRLSCRAAEQLIRASGRPGVGPGAYAEPTVTRLIWSQLHPPAKHFADPYRACPVRSKPKNRVVHHEEVR